MSLHLGIDTSNYTTSVAIFDSETKKVIHLKKLLPVKSGERGIRQSDAVFHHTQQLRELMAELGPVDVDSVGVSIRPRFADDSYMPCFTVGQTVATSIASVLGKPLYEVSHQEGHVMAALYSADKLDMMGEDFIAFHVSGGTTESLMVHPSERCPVSCTMIGSSSDLKAGQAIDRVGVMMGLNFPCGPELEKLALRSTLIDKPLGIKVSSVDGNPSISGVENKCQKMFDEGCPHEDIALYCLRYIEQALLEMLAVTDSNLPVVFSGGVMSNSILQSALRDYCSSNGRKAYFATPEFSSDNAAGVAILASYFKE